MRVVHTHKCVSIWSMGKAHISANTTAIYEEAIVKRNGVYQKKELLHDSLPGMLHVLPCAYSALVLTYGRQNMLHRVVRPLAGQKAPSRSGAPQLHYAFVTGKAQ